MVLATSYGGRGKMERVEKEDGKGRERAGLKINMIGC